MGVLEPITDLIRTVTRLARGGGDQRDEQHELPRAPEGDSAPEQERAREVPQAPEAQQVPEEKETHEQPADIQSHLELLSVILAGITTHYEYEKLEGLSRPEPFLVLWRKEMKDELERLEALQYVDVTSPGGIEQIGREHGGGSREFDLKQYARITGRGQQYLRLRHRYDRVAESGT